MCMCWYGCIDSGVDVDTYLSWGCGLGDYEGWQVPSRAVGKQQTQETQCQFQSTGRPAPHPGRASVSAEFEGRQKPTSESKAGRQEELSLTQGEWRKRVNLFVLFRLSTDWMRPTHIRGSTCLTQSLPILRLISFQNRNTQNNDWPNIQAPVIKLTYKITHHSILPTHTFKSLACNSLTSID